jgi:hypothetical protein
MMEEARSLNTFFRPITDKEYSANFVMTQFSEVGEVSCNKYCNCVMRPVADAC